MTISLAWIRNSNKYPQLVVAADSRLRFGCAWDCCPKILPLPRSDSVICFAGDTDYAYPLMLQMKSAIELSPESMDRALDLHDLKGHTLRVFNDMRDYIHDLPQGSEEPEYPKTVFLLAGYSWKANDFRIWYLHFDYGIRRFTYRPTRRWHGVRGLRKLNFGNDCKIAFAGDGEHLIELKRRLIELLYSRQGNTIHSFDMEPFEILRDMLREVEPSSSIGGPPQVVKVYRHMNYQPISLRWPDAANGKLTALGRPILGYEHIRCPEINVDTLEITPPKP